MTDFSANMRGPRIPLNPEAIRQKREGRGLSQEALDAKAGVYSGATKNGEHGKRLTLPNAEKLATALGCLLREIAAEGYEEELSPGNDKRSFPLPVMIPASIIFSHDLENLEPLKEVIAIRQADGEFTVLGYGNTEKDTLYALMDRFLGGGMDGLKQWGEIDARDAVVFKEGLGIAIGCQDDEYPKVTIGWSGRLVRMELSSRTPLGETAGGGSGIVKDSAV